MTAQDPLIGHWFTKPGGSGFEVVAIDEDEATVEIQQFDGTIDQIDVKVWQESSFVEVAAPEDWSGSVDMDPEDFVGKSDTDMPIGFFDPLGFLDQD
jgi:hypothetical protein